MDKLVRKKDTFIATKVVSYVYRHHWYEGSIAGRVKISVR